MLKLEQIYKTDKERVGSLMDIISNVPSLASIRTKQFSNIFTKNKSDTGADKSELLKSIREGYASRAQSFIVYDYCIYWGYFTNFSYTESATDRPRQYSYNFTFKVVNSTTDWLSQSLISNFPEARILNLFSQVGQLGDYVASMATSGDKLLKGIFL